MPHQKKHTKTKEGYLIKIEEYLNLTENLPRTFYRLDIEKARELYEATITSGRAGFDFMCKFIEDESQGRIKGLSTWKQKSEN